MICIWNKLDLLNACGEYRSSFCFLPSRGISLSILRYVSEYKPWLDIMNEDYPDLVRSVIVSELHQGSSQKDTKSGMGGGCMSVRLIRGAFAV